MRKRVTVVGAGFVGEHVACGIAQRELADVVTIDILEGVPQGKSLDLFEASPVLGFDARITGSTDRYEETSGSDIVVITAGLARKPGMSRDDLLMKNASIVGSVAGKVARHSPKAIVIVVSNPLDVMCYVTLKVKYSTATPSRSPAKCATSDQVKRSSAAVPGAFGLEHDGPCADRSRRSPSPLSARTSRH